MAAPFQLSQVTPRVETDPVEVTFRSVFNDIPEWKAPSDSGIPSDSALHFSSMAFIADVKKAFEFPKGALKKVQCKQHLDYCSECGGVACSQDCGAFDMGDPSAECTCILEYAPFPIEDRINDDYAPPPSLCRSLSHTEYAEQEAWRFMLACKEGECILHNYWISETMATFNYLVREGNVFYREAFTIIKSTDIDRMPVFHHNYTAAIQREVAEFVALKAESASKA